MRSIELHDLSFLKKLVRIDRLGFSMYEALNVGKYKVSIQASQYHYCAPRETLDSPEQYDSFELAIFDELGGWILPETDPKFKLFPWVELFLNSGQTSVAGYVPKELISSILEDITNIG